jgi:transcriptional regulator with XRE-family HTH domain
MEQESWTARLTQGIGRRVAAARREQHISARALAQRCADLGMPTLTRQVIAFIENGRRGSVSVAELLVLGAALEIPPMNLLFPVGRETEIEYLPGHMDTPWYAVRWAAGTWDTWPGHATAWQLFRRHDQLVRRALEGTWDERDVARGDLRYLRRSAIADGYEPPQLPRELAHLDNAERGDD